LNGRRWRFAASSGTQFPGRACAVPVTVPVDKKPRRPQSAKRDGEQSRRIAGSPTPATRTTGDAGQPRANGGRRGSGRSTPSPSKGARPTPPPSTKWRRRCLLDEGDVVRYCCLYC